MLGTSGPPARSTRARFAAAAAITLMTNCQADEYQWKHKKHNPVPTAMELNEIANVVLEGDKVLKYR